MDCAVVGIDNIGNVVRNNRGLFRINVSRTNIIFKDVMRCGFFTDWNADRGGLKCRDEQTIRCSFTFCRNEIEMIIGNCQYARQIFFECADPLPIPNGFNRMGIFIIKSYREIICKIRVTDVINEGRKQGSIWMTIVPALNALYPLLSLSSWWKCIIDRRT